MAHITKVPLLRHLRSEPSRHVLHFRRGRLVRSGRGVAYWFRPLSASIAEVPCDDRDLAFLFHGRTSDFQDVTVQGVITWRVKDPEVIARRVDFSIDPLRGAFLGTPLEQIAQLMSQLAQQFAWDYLIRTPLRAVLAEGLVQICERIREGLSNHAPLAAMGLEVASVRVSGVAPTPDLEKALQTPTREAIQEEADQAVFKRRALAVEKERAIQENELQNRIEIARREEGLIAQEGQNARRKATEAADAGRIEAEAAGARRRIEAAAQAESLALVEQSRNVAERARIDIFRDLPSAVLLGLAAREMAGKLQSIDHLNLTPDLLGPLLARLAEAGAERLEARPPAPPPPPPPRPERKPPK
ncbi:MAG: SPFH domain-containing protein [Planctomycetes bacterium]|nr:SPFH domain-containing protein [Planctomycetota bacterium]